MILLEQKAIYSRSLTPLSWLAISLSYWRKSYSPLDSVNRGWTIIPPRIIFWQSAESVCHDFDTDDGCKGMLCFGKTVVNEMLK
jgi:hypothetical protein